MNCQEFENFTDDLATGRLKQSVVEDCVTHLGLCSGCAARYESARYLSNTLHDLASRTAAHAGAPDQVEESLRAAFRLRLKDSERIPVRAPFRNFNFSSWSFAAAAVLVLAVLLPVALPVAMKYLPLAREYWSSTNAPSDSQRTTRVETQTTTPDLNVGNITGIAPEDSHDTYKEKASHADHVSFAEPPRWKRHITRAVSAPEFARPPAVASASNKGERDSEIATEFLPLSVGFDQTTLSGGRLIRVELPRSALVSFGLPMNMEHAGERVKADVIMGDDGLAHAIRFVH